MIEDLQISGHTVRYTFESFKCEFIMLQVPEYFSLLQMLEAEDRLVHESRIVDFTLERKEYFIED